MITGRSEDKDAVRREMRADDRRSDPHVTVKLPCCGTQVEIKRAGDQMVLCPNPKCGKRSAITWSMFDPKITTEADRHGDFYVGRK